MGTVTVRHTAATTEEMRYQERYRALMEEAGRYAARGCVFMAQREQREADLFKRKLRGERLPLRAIADASGHDFAWRYANGDVRYVRVKA